MPIHSFKDLIVWQKSIALAKEVYGLTSELPKEELYGLSSQMKRSAISVASNIAEGYARNHRNEYRQFLSIAQGSVAELETQIVLMKELYDNIDTATAYALLNEVQRMLFSLSKSLPAKP